jgi:hypothetical protein
MGICRLGFQLFTDCLPPHGSMPSQEGAGKRGMIVLWYLGTEAKVSFHLEDPGTQIVLVASRVGGGSFGFGGIGDRGDNWGNGRGWGWSRWVVKLVGQIFNLEAHLLHCIGDSRIHWCFLVLD